MDITNKNSFIPVLEIGKMRAYRWVNFVIFLKKVRIVWKEEGGEEDS